MQLKTVEEVAHGSNGKRISKILTEDRADIRAVLREEIANMKGVYSAKDVIDKALTLIDTLLPGDVSK